MNEGIGDILIETGKKKTQKEKVEYLREKRKKYPHLFGFLKYTFKDGIQFNLPPGPVEDSDGNLLYKPAPKEMDLQNVLYSKIRKMKVFMRGEYPNMSATKREGQFIELLETVDPDDAKFLIGMKDKKCNFPGITKSLVKKAFPEETKDW